MLHVLREYSFTIRFRQNAFKVVKNRQESYKLFQFCLCLRPSQCAQYANTLEYQLLLKVMKPVVESLQDGIGAFLVGHTK